MKVLYFTSTGNSLYVAKQFDAELFSIPKMLKENKFCFEDDKIGIVFPTYGLSQPTIVKEFLSKVTLISPYIFVVTTCGDASFGTTNSVEKLLKAKKINVSYMAEIKMADNYLPLYEMSSSIEKAKSKNIEKNLSDLLGDVNNNIKKVKKAKPLDSILTFSGHKVMKVLEKSNYKKFIVEDNCNLCGTCEKVCPKNNIEIKEKVVYNKSCIGCYACTHNCPQNAIRHKKEKSKARFRNENVTLKEIIDSNNLT
ncbi:MAG: EFR1 family ferrodoxin [Lachnospirales bacterium]